MLPKIPYKMEKNKSQSIPMRSINLGSAAEVGELSDSLGISTRKFPYLTTRKGDVALTDLAVNAMTVFNCELITVRPVGDDKVGLYIADGSDPVCELEGTGKRQFATINSKLVVYPDKVYVEREGGEWKAKTLGAEVVLPEGRAAFGTSYLKSLSKDKTESISGYGGYFSKEDKSFSVAFARTNGAGYNGDLFVGSDGYFATASLVGNSFEFTLEDGKYTLSIECFNFDSNPLLQNLDLNLKLAVYDASYDRSFFLGYLESYEVSKKEIDLNTLTIRGETPDWMINIADGTDVVIYALGAPSDGKIDLENLIVGLPDGKKQYVEMMDLDKNILIAGLIAQEGTQEGAQEGERKDELIFEGCYVPSPNVILNVNYLYARIYGWNNPITKLLEDDVIYFPDSELNVGHYTVKQVDESTTGVVIYFSDTDDITNEIIPQNKRVSIEYFSEDIKDLTLLRAGDVVEISGSSISENNVTFVISEIRGDTLYAAADIFVEGTSLSGVTVTRRIPELDFICEKDNRLYGVCNDDKTIYVSALGDPTNMYAYEGISTDSFAVAVGGEGDFTACCKYGEAVLFFKEDKLYKLTGSYPAEFALYSYDAPGVAEGSEKSCVVINEVLYYHGTNGIYAYTGGIPVLISECFGERRFSGGVGGTDGRYYYLSVRDDEDAPYLFTYDTRTQLWLIEHKVRCVDFARATNALFYANEDGGVYKVGVGDASGEWLARWAPIYEIIDGKRSYSRILVRVSLPRGSYIIVRIRCDGGEWREAGKIIGRTENVVPIRIPINRCDKFELELSGKGECTILDIMREFYVGSEV